MSILAILDTPLKLAATAGAAVTGIVGGGWIGAGQVTEIIKIGENLKKVKVLIGEGVPTDFKDTDISSNGGEWLVVFGTNLCGTGVANTTDDKFPSVHGLRIRSYGSHIRCFVTE